MYFVNAINYRTILMRRTAKNINKESIFTRTVKKVVLEMPVASIDQTQETEDRAH